MIPFICLHCGGKLDVPEEYIGQKIRCPVCATVGLVASGKFPRETPAPAPGPVRKADDAAAALEAKFHAHGPAEKAAPGAGGSKQYDLAAVVSAPAPETSEAAAAPPSEAPPEPEPQKSPDALDEIAAAASPEPEPREPADALDELAAAASAAPKPAAAQPLVATPVAIPVSGPAGAAGARPPAYLGVRVMGFFYIVCGILCWVVGLIELVVLVIGGIRGGDLSGIVASSGLGLAIAIGLFILGLVQVGMGQLFLCVRDLARNSFHLRKL